MTAKMTTAAQTGAQLVVRALEAQGVNHIFGVPGAKIDAVFNALVDSNIKTVVCRHEQNAAFIAGGIGRMTGKAGAAIATSGPGVSNLTTGLATANTKGDPVVAIGGAVATDEALKKIHQSMDSVSILKKSEGSSTLEAMRVTKSSSGSHRGCRSRRSSKIRAVEFPPRPLSYEYSLAGPSMMAPPWAPQGERNGPIRKISGKIDTGRGCGSRKM